MRDRLEWDADAFAAYLKTVLAEADLKPPQLATLAGISRPQIYRWLNGEGRPMYDNLVQLGDALAEHRPALGIGRREVLEAAAYDAEGAPPAEGREPDLSVVPTVDLLDQIDAAVAEIRRRSSD